MLKHLNKLPLLAGFCIIGWIIWSQSEFKHARGAFEPKNSPLNSGSDTQTGWKVQSIDDGNRLHLSKKRQQINVQLCGINIPQKTQPWGVESQKTLKSLMPENQEVLLMPINEERSGRIVAEIFVPGTPEIHINSELTLRGMAYVDRHNSRMCRNEQAIMTGEAIALEKKMGVWSENPRL